MGTVWSPGEAPGAPAPRGRSGAGPRKKKGAGRTQSHEPTSPAPHPGFQHPRAHAHACWCALCARVCGGARWREHVLTKVAHVCPWACACTRAHRRCVRMSVCPQECVCVCLPIPPLRWGLCKHFSDASPWRRGAPPPPPLPGLPSLALLGFWGITGHPTPGEGRLVSQAQMCGQGVPGDSRAQKGGLL